jgi:hypothetical protein
LSTRRAGDVFLNIPFAPTHEFLYIALVAGLTALRLNPRCVLEIPPQQHRLQRLFDHIRGCAFSIHDLSHVKLSPGKGSRVPRFNMPFELGIAVAIALAEQQTKDQHQFRIFEAQPFRLQKSLSDVLGHDPYVHRGSADGVLEAVLNVFSNLEDAPAPSEMRRLHRRLRQFRQEELGRDVFQPKPFKQLVVAARAIVGEL